MLPVTAPMGSQVAVGRTGIGRGGREEERQSGVVAAATDACPESRLDTKDELIGELEVVAGLWPPTTPPALARVLPLGRRTGWASQRAGRGRADRVIRDHHGPRRPTGRRWRPSRRRSSDRRRGRSTAAGAAAAKNIDRRFLARRKISSDGHPAASVNAIAPPSIKSVSW